ncbi:MAG: glycosyltransferase [Bacteroidetes bacterium]|nr:glycosyltransferase [Bacteroidota bacterium]
MPATCSPCAAYTNSVLSPFRLPSWLHRLEPVLPDPTHPSPERLEAVRQGLARFRTPDPEVSILIAVRNDERYLFRALESLSRLDLPWSAELVLVDNRSTDATATLATACGVSVFHEHRPGLSYARQTALERARGRYVLCAEPDTLYPPGWAASLVGVLQTHPEVSCVYGSYHFLPQKSYPHWKLLVYRYLGDPIQSFRAIRHEFTNVMGFSMAYRRLDALRVGGYPGEDQMDRQANRESEFGRLALKLSLFGKLHFIDELENRVWTSPRRLEVDGGIGWSLARRAFRELLRPFNGRRRMVIE